MTLFVVNRALLGRDVAFLERYSRWKVFLPSKFESTTVISGLSFRGYQFYCCLTCQSTIRTNSFFNRYQTDSLECFLSKTSNWPASITPICIIPRPSNVRTLATNDEILTSPESLVDAKRKHQESYYTKRTKVFLDAYQKVSHDKEHRLQSHSDVTFYDSRWWTELEYIVLCWSHIHTANSHSLHMTQKLLLDVALPEYHRLLRSTFFTTQNLNEQDNKESKTHLVMDAVTSSTRLILFYVLDHIRICHKRKTPLNIRSDSVLRFYKASDIWAELKQLGDLPDVRSFNLVLSILSLEAETEEDLSTGLAHSTEKKPLDPLSVLTYMDQLNNTHQQPDDITWGAAITVWAKRARYNWKNHSDTPDRVYEIIRLMQSHSYNPRKITIINVLEALAHSNLPDVAQKMFDQFYADISSKCFVCYFHVIRAHCQSNTPNGAEMAYTLLLKMLNNYIRYCEGDQQPSGDSSSMVADAASETDPPARPGFEIVTLVISALAKHGADPEKLVTLLRQVQYYDNICNGSSISHRIIEHHKDELFGLLTNIIGMYVKQKRPEDAETLLYGISETFTHDKRNKTTDSSMIDCPNQALSLRPNVQLVCACMNAWAESGHHDAPEKAESILSRYFFDDGSYLHPNSYAFSSVMKAWVRSKRPEAPDRCEAILRQMWELSDSSHSLATKSGNNETERHSGLLNNEQRKPVNYDSTISCSPTVVTYGTLLHAWLEAGRNGDLRASERAEAIYRDLMMHGIQPNHEMCRKVIELVASLGSILRANLDYLSRLTYIEKAAKTSSLLFDELVEKHSFKPPIQSFTIRAQCWLHLSNLTNTEKNKMSAYKKAKNILKEMTLYLQKENGTISQTGHIDRMKQNIPRDNAEVTSARNTKLCTDTFTFLINTLSHCSQILWKDPSKELKDIEKMIQSLGIMNDSIENAIQKARSLWTSTQNKNNIKE